MEPLTATFCVDFIRVKAGSGTFLSRNVSSLRWINKRFSKLSAADCGDLVDLVVVCVAGVRLEGAVTAAGLD